jgi:flagellar biosynthesis protein FlhB
MSGEKSEKATAKKHKQNRKEGKIPRTQELGAWSALAVVALALPKLFRHEATALQRLMETSLTVGGRADVPTALQVLGDGLMHVLIAVLVIGTGVLLIGVTAAVSQGGFYLASSSVKPTLSKINPLKGLKRIFAVRTLWEGGKMLMRSAVVVGLVWMTIKSAMPMIGGLVPMQVVIDQTGASALTMIRNVAVVGIVLGAADYIMQRRMVGKQARMTKDEVKQEYKQSEGDPMLKGAMRSRQLAASRNRMMADVPKADVVLVNPTHVAVALSYDPDHGAPRVVARGAGVIATAIRERAGEAGVPLVRDIPLARALYSSTVVGQEIPTELFAAVAQVLAFVISRRTRGQRGGEHHSPRADPTVPPVSPPGRRRRDASGPAAVGR